MVYCRGGRRREAWYVGFERRDRWRVERTVWISPQKVAEYDDVAKRLSGEGGRDDVADGDGRT